jgi:hypothetical protein
VGHHLLKDPDVACYLAGAAQPRIESKVIEGDADRRYDGVGSLSAVVIGNPKGDLAKVPFRALAQSPDHRV